MNGEIIKKCEWKKSVLHFCTDMTESIGKYEYRDNLARGIFNGAHVTCNFCGTDLTKPEDPIIKKSGETWVKRENGIDYIWNDQINEHSSGNDSYNERTWIKFPDEITDEIAKLKPMVKCVNGKEVIGPPQKLIHIVDIQCFTLKEKPINPEHYHSTDWMHINKCNLATVSDLAPEPEPDDSFIMCPKCYCANNPARVTCSECGGILK